MDKLRAIKTFLAIAGTGSLTAAAKVEQTSLPAVVRLLAALETDLGVKLFQRTTRKVSLTEAGSRYRESSLAMLSLLADAESDLHANQKEARGKLVVTAPVMFGQLHVTPGILAFLKKHPRVQIELRLLDRLANLVEEGVDVAIRIGHLEDSTLVARRAGAMRRVVVATPTYLKSHGRPKVPSDLTQHNCIRFWNGSPQVWSFVDQKRTLAIPVSGNFSANHSLAAAEACAQGLGIGLFPIYQVARWIRSSTLQVLLPDFEAEPKPIHLVVPEARLLPQRTQLFLDFMRRHLESEAAAWQL